MVRRKFESEAFNEAFNNYEANNFGNNAAEFVGNDCSALSLDGRSLIVPDYGDVDDMSSLGAPSKYTYRGDGGGANVRYIGDKKIVGKAGDYKTDPRAMSSLEKKLSSHYREDAAEGKDADLSQSFEEKKNDEAEGKKSGCLPKWIADAPLWLKLIIISSVALLVGALVLIAVGAQLSTENSPSSSLQDENPEAGAGVATSNTDAPTLMVASIPNVSPSFAPPESESDVSSSAPSSALSASDTWDLLTTQSPSHSPSHSPTTAYPSHSPSQSPTTAYPSHSPTTSPSHSPTTSPSHSPTISPSHAPTTSPSYSPTTSYPSASPTQNPTKTPTQTPTISTVNFFVMGGRFDGEDTKVLSNGLQSLPTMDENTMLVHLGDWNSPYATSCLEDSYITNVDSYQKSSVPVYFVPGDNEYNDCPNPTEALGFWNQYLLGFETKYWQDPSWSVLRQSPDYSENFAFLQREVLFVGINLVGGIVHDQAEWDARHEANLLWIDTAAAKYDGSYTTMVVFAHADPDIEINQNFFNDFYPMVERYDEQVLFIHRNLGIDTWKKEKGYNGIPNLEVVTVEGSKWPPMWVQIDPISGTYAIDQSSWYDQYVANGKLPPTP